MIYVSGHSDDLIDIQGDLENDFNVFGKNEIMLAFSDGTVLEFIYKNYQWTINVLKKGIKYKGKSKMGKYDEDSETAIFTKGIKWIMKGEEIIL